MRYPGQPITLNALADIFRKNDLLRFGVVLGVECLHQRLAHGHKLHTIQNAAHMQYADHADTDAHLHAKEYIFCQLV